jgi:hypothetical protein
MSENYKMRILCLADSRKNSGRCVAGRVIGGEQHGQWIRPISSRATGELSDDDRRYQNGKTVRVKDVVSIPLKSQRSHAFQLENHVIDENYYWEFERKAEWEEIYTLVEQVDGELWDNSSSGYYGVHDRIAEAAAPDIVTEFGGSLVLIEVHDLVIKVSMEGAAFGNGKRKVRGQFSCSKCQYLIAVTDPRVETIFLAKNDGSYPVGRAILCLSLGEPYNDHVYKLIAAVFLPPRA